jgi:hypothetical protein
MRLELLLGLMNDLASMGENENALVRGHEPLDELGEHDRLAGARWSNDDRPLSGGKCLHDAVDHVYLIGTQNNHGARPLRLGATMTAVMMAMATVRPASSRRIL